MASIFRKAPAERDVFLAPNGAGGVWRVEVLAFCGANARVRLLDGGVRVLDSGTELTVPIDQLSKEGKRRTR
ncbi:MAG: hypothetical protein QM651_16940 [Rhodoblastus sp.]